MVDLLVANSGASWESGQAKFNGDIAKGIVLGQACVFLKPMTFMNLSGRSVGAVQRFFKINPEDTIVCFDDVDLPSGKVRAREGGGHGGHNGVRSIIEETGNNNFHRLKLGVGRPPDNRDTADWVLSELSDTELKALGEEMRSEVELRLKQIFDKQK